MSEVPHAASTEARARQAATLPQILDAGFDAFEFIRITARSYQDQVPELFAAFMTAADTAANGREALTIAPSLPRHAEPMPEGAASADAGAGQAADVLAELAAALRERLTAAARQADLPDDQAGCHDAVGAVGQICQLMTR